MTPTQRLFDCFEESSRRQAKRVAVKIDRRVVTYDELRDMAGGFSRALASAGLRRGDRVGTLMSNSPEWIALWWAVGQVGAAAVPINLRLAPRERAAICRDARFTLLLCDRHEDAEAIADEPTAARIVRVFGADGQAFFKSGESTSSQEVALLSHSVEETDPALIVYTSGTTGKPKGVVLTHRNILSNITRQNVHFGADPEMKMVSALPFSHVGGATETVVATLLAGGSLALAPKFDPGAVWDLVEAERATFLGGVPTMLALMLQHPSLPGRDLSSLRRIVYAGAPCSPTLFEKIRRLGVVMQTGYGMTEASGFVTYTDPDDPPEAIRDTVGKIDEHFGLRIVNGQRQPIPTGEIGEVSLQGDCITPGYLFDNEATRAAIDEEGWYYTGDLGFLDPAGRLRLSGRKKEMYITGGYNVYPAEVEAYLETHDGVTLAACLGVPDETMGEVGWAFVVPSNPNLPTPEELLAFCRTGLARYKIPARFIIRPQLPMTALGKIDKQALRGEIEGMGLK